MISVIMSTYNESEHVLRAAIESIVAQTYRNIEFIIILDDPENELHKQIISEYAQKDSRIIFFVNQENLRLAGCLNKAIAYAHGEYIARMDADDISAPDRLASQLRYLEENGLELIGGLLQVISNDDQEMYAIRRVPSSPETIRKCLKFGNCVAHPSWFGTKKIFSELGGYRELPICQDYDFLLRAALRKYRIGNQNIPVLKYRLGAHSVSRSNLYRQYLTMRYISGEYCRGLIADEKKIGTYVEKNFTEQKADSFLKAEKLFYESLKSLEAKKYFLFLYKILSVLFISREYFEKTLRFGILSLYAFFDRGRG